MSKNILIVYYTRSANTQKAAQSIAQVTGGDCLELVLKTPYPQSYRSVLAQAKKEMNSRIWPELKNQIKNIDQYDTVFIGTPNWFNSFAPPVGSFLESHDLSGKKVIPFCTHGGGGFGHIEQDIAERCPNAKVLRGLSIYGSSFSVGQIATWIKKLGMESLLRDLDANKH